jgi:hypothetical protein
MRDLSAGSMTGVVLCLNTRPRFSQSKIDYKVFTFLLQTAGGAASVQVSLGELADLQFEITDPFHEAGIITLEFFETFFHIIC